MRIALASSWSRSFLNRGSVTAVPASIIFAKRHDDFNDHQPPPPPSTPPPLVSALRSRDGGERDQDLNSRWQDLRNIDISFDTSTVPIAIEATAIKLLPPLPQVNVEPIRNFEQNTSGKAVKVGCVRLETYCNFVHEPRRRICHQWPLSHHFPLRDLMAM